MSKSEGARTPCKRGKAGGSDKKKPWKTEKSGAEKGRVFGWGWIVMSTSREGTQQEAGKNSLEGEGGSPFEMLVLNPSVGNVPSR